MKIELGKKYKSSEGRVIRIVCVDRNDPLPVVGIYHNPLDPRKTEGVICLDPQGQNGSWPSCTLVSEVSEWDDVPMDTIVWVSGGGGPNWVPRYFYKVIGGRPWVFDNGASSLTANGGERPDPDNAGMYASAWQHTAKVKP